MSYHLTYLQAVVTGLVQGVTELFPVSSLGHNVLLPALIGGSWAKTLNVSATGSPYLAFIVGLHVATAVAMIAFFWRDWLRIVRGFFSSIGQRRIATPDQRLAWMIILGTIPVGIVGVVLQKEVTKVLAKPELAAVFLAINGVILLVSERMRRAREAREAGRTDVAAAPRPAFDGPTGGAGYGPRRGGLRAGGRAGLRAGRQGRAGRRRGTSSSRGSSSGRGRTPGTGETTGSSRRTGTGTGSTAGGTPAGTGRAASPGATSTGRNRISTGGTRGAGSSHSSRASRSSRPAARGTSGGPSTGRSNGAASRRRGWIPGPSKAATRATPRSSGRLGPARPT